MGRDIFWQKWAVGVEMKKSLIWRCSESHTHTTFAVVSLLRFRCVCVCLFFFPSKHWSLTGVFIKVASSVSGPEPNRPVPPPDHETGDVWADADLARPLWKNMFWSFCFFFFLILGSANWSKQRLQRDRRLLSEDGKNVLLVLGSQADREWMYASLLFIF